jgi:signal transduction histidine kinase
MRIGIKGKQVLGVTTIVGVVVVGLSVIHLSRLASVSLAETRARAEFIANAIYHRAREVVVEDDDVLPSLALRQDPGLRSIIESSLYSNNVTSAAIVDVGETAVIHVFPAEEGRRVASAGDLSELVARPAFSQLLAIYRSERQNLEWRQPLLLGETQFGSIRIGVSTLLIRRELNDSLRPAIVTALVALAIAVFGAMLLAQIVLRPIHVIRSGLTRLGRGEFGVKLDLSQRDEFGELGTFFNTASAQIAADRTQMAGQVANLESAVERLEDAVAIVGPHGKFLFANPALRALLPGASVGAKLSDVASEHSPLRDRVEQTLSRRQSLGPLSASLPTGEGETSDYLILTHPIIDQAGQLVGVMVVARNLEYLSQVQSTIRYSRKLAALGRLSAGVAHEVKNPLNAMMIHLELLRQRFQPNTMTVRSAARATGTTGPVLVDANPPQVNVVGALEHVDVIAAEIKRLDEVVQGFLKFTRPEDLSLQPVALERLLAEVVPIVRSEAEPLGIELVVEASTAPDVNGDPSMLRQAFLNLALNSCQAMPNGGTLTIRAESARGRFVIISVEDTGVGIKPESLPRIFDLYFTTREKGSGIGLSMVYRTIQMHDGEIEVQSTPGKGTTFRVLLPQA